MNGKMLISAAAAALLLGATGASADCREDLAKLTEGVSKDGSMAPLQESSSVATQDMDKEAASKAAEGSDTAMGGTAAMGSETASTDSDQSGEVAKDGTEEPLNADPDLATSGQDAQAQSEGGETAAEQAMAGDGSEDRDAAIARAQAALDAGDEAACMEALEEAKGA